MINYIIILIIESDACLIAYILYSAYPIIMTMCMVANGKDKS